MSARAIAIIGSVLALAFGATSARAAMYGFTNITGNSATSAAIGEAQLFVEVSDAGGGMALFTFKNLGPEASSITDVYFDDVDADEDDDEDNTSADGSYLDKISAIVNGTGVAYSEGASPGNVPGHNNVLPTFDTDFSADSDAPAQPNGVNPGEQLDIKFDLESDVSFADLIAALGSGAVRIGVHVQGFANGQSEGFVNTTPVPAPGAGLLGMAGLALVAWLRLRKPTYKTKTESNRA